MKKTATEDCLYEVRWHGRGRTLMSRSYCRDRASVQKYIDECNKRLKKQNAFHVLTRGNSPDYFETIDKNDYDSGISICKVDKVQEPYNMLEDKFQDLRLLFCCPFRAVIDNEDLKKFAEQEKASIEANKKLYSMLI